MPGPLCPLILEVMGQSSLSLGLTLSEPLLPKLVNILVKTHVLSLGLYYDDSCPPRPQCSYYSEATPGRSCHDAVCRTLSRIEPAKRSPLPITPLGFSLGCFSNTPGIKPLSSWSLMRVCRLQGSKLDKDALAFGRVRIHRTHVEQLRRQSSSLREEF